MYIFIVSGIVFVTVFLLTFTLFTRRRLRTVTEKENVVKQSIFILLVDSIVNHLSVYLSKTNYPLMENVRLTLNQTLSISKPEIARKYDADKFLSLMFLAAFTGLLIGGVIFNTINPVYLGLFFIASGSLPYLWLVDTIQVRQRNIFRALPDAMDIITVSVESGLDFTAAVNKLVLRCEPNLLIDEFKLTLQELQIGKTRAQALQDMAKRVKLPVFDSVCSSIIQAIQMGANLGPILRTQADQLRQQRFQMAEKLAAQAPTKMLFPLLIFIFPTVFIVLFGPIVMMFIQSQ